MLVTGVVVATALAGCGSRASSEPDAGPAAPRRTASIRPPAHGALFGAYVDPPEYVEPARISAVEHFEEQIGRRLAVYHDYHTWTDPFPSASDTYFADRGTTLLLSWAGTDTRTILSGADDAMIRARAAALARLGRPVLLRWRWEMNRPNLAAEIHSGGDYIAAWRHLHDLFAEAGATNVGWVWCPLVDAPADHDYAAYYPGDDDVDWLCADGYARSEGQSFEAVFGPFLDWASAIDKPIIIGEFGREAQVAGSRADWLADARRFVKQTPRIKALVYFESSRESIGSWAVADDPRDLAAFRAWGADPYFDPR